MQKALLPLIAFLLSSCTTSIQGYIDDAKKTASGRVVEVKDVVLEITEPVTDAVEDINRRVEDVTEGVDKVKEGVDQLKGAVPGGD